jgi:putative SOS response-associated peptidase YedK
MCGRYSLHASPGVIALQFGLGQPVGFTPRYNIPPGTEVLAVHVGPRDTRAGELLRWGLIPSWAKDPSIGNRMNNARAETITEKPSFRSAFRRRRCILPANGFFEWKTVAGRKQPYYIRPRGDELFGFAALYEHWDGPAGRINSCAVITTAPNELMREIHDRMPVILPVEAYAHWLDPVSPDPGALLNLLVPCPAEKMTAFAVDPRVNNVRNEDAALIEPMQADLLG